MIRLLLSAMLALGLTACSLTSEERSAIRDSVSDTVLLAIEEARAFGVGPIEVDQQALDAAALACRLLDIGSPLITTGLNILVDRRNAQAAADDQVAPVTLEEFRGSVEDGCAIVAALLVPAPADPSPDTAPEPEPAPAA